MSSYNYTILIGLKSLIKPTTSPSVSPHHRAAICGEESDIGVDPPPATDSVNVTQAMGRYPLKEITQVV